MKLIKVKRLLISSILMVAFNIEDTSAMVRAKYEKFSVRCPLSVWPKVGNIVRSSAVDKYNELWDEKSSLEDNRKRLLDKFMSTCCDFSFQEVPLNIKGVKLGKVQSGDGLIFVDQGVKFRIRPALEKVWLYKVDDKTQGVKVPLGTNVFVAMKPVGYTEEIKKKLIGYLEKISEDSVGCELFRRAIVKYELCQGNIDKIKFIPVEREGLDLYFVLGKDIRQYLSREGSLSYIRDFRINKKFIMFSPNLEDNNPNREGLKVKLRADGRRTEMDKFSIERGNYPVDAGLFYQLVYAFNEDYGSVSTKTIEDRSNNNTFSFNVDGFGKVSVPSRQLNVSIFVKDSIYKAMYGLTPVGLNLLNEASYLAHRYNCVRPSYIGAKSKLKMNDNQMNSDSMFDFVLRFLRANGDEDLYEYYLSPDSSIEYPEFGKGAYKCSDR